MRSECEPFTGGWWAISTWGANAASLNANKLTSGTTQIINSLSESRREFAGSSWGAMNPGHFIPKCGAVYLEYFVLQRSAFSSVCLYVVNDVRLPSSSEFWLAFRNATFKSEAKQKTKWRFSSCIHHARCVFGLQLLDFSSSEHFNFISERFSFFSHLIESHSAASAHGKVLSSVVSSFSLFFLLFFLLDPQTEHRRTVFSFSSGVRLFSKETTLRTSTRAAECRLTNLRRRLRFYTHSYSRAYSLRTWSTFSALPTRIRLSQNNIRGAAHDGSRFAPCLVLPHKVARCAWSARCFRVSPAVQLSVLTRLTLD